MPDQWTDVLALQAEIAALGPADATAYQLWMERHYHDTVTVYHPTRKNDEGNSAAVVIPVGQLNSKIAGGFTFYPVGPDGKPVLPAGVEGDEAIEGAGLPNAGVVPGGPPLAKLQAELQGDTSKRYAGLDRQELQVQLQRRNLPSDGEDQELIDRLVAADGDDDHTVASVNDVESMGEDSIRAELTRRGLPADGNFQDIVERLISEGPTRGEIGRAGGELDRSDEDEGAGDDGDEDDGDERTAAELREELRGKGLPVSGNKAELIARLEEAGE